MKRKICLVLLTVIILLASTLPVYAETSTDYSKKIDDANKKLDQLEGDIDKGLQAVQDIEDEITKTQDEINALDTELKQLNNNIQEKEKELTEKKDLLEERMVAMYMSGDTTYLDVLLSGGFVDFVSNYYFVSQIVEYDSNLIDEVETIKKSLEDDKAKVESKKQEKVTKQDSLKSLKSEKQKKVDSLTSEQKSLQKQVDDWDTKMKELQEIERGASSGNEYDGRQLQWPAPASRRITSPYGYRNDPIYKVYKFHTGIDIGAAYGTNIVAAESGTVLLASYGYNSGYGNYIIINHGNGLTTRYAHCSSLNVTTGQTVSRGQVIGLIGSTGNSTGAHLHFEVRINGTHYNPLDYL